MEDMKLYSTLFNAITDAMREIKKLNFGRAEDILLHAQLGSVHISTSTMRAKKTKAKKIISSLS